MRVCSPCLWAHSSISYTVICSAAAGRTCILSTLLAVFVLLRSLPSFWRSHTLVVDRLTYVHCTYEMADIRLKEVHVGKVWLRR